MKFAALGSPGSGVAAASGTVTLGAGSPGESASAGTSDVLPDVRSCIACFLRSRFSRAMAIRFSDSRIC